GAKATAEEIPYVVLQHQLVPLDAVELELGLEHGSHLGRAAGDDAQLAVALGPELADERRGARDRLFLAGLLQRRADQLPKGVELRLEVGLVEVPAVDATGRPRVDAVRKCHRSSALREPLPDGVGNVRGDGLRRDLAGVGDGPGLRAAV